jgi:hypothetical protein
MIRYDRGYSNIHQDDIENGLVAPPNYRDIAIDEVAPTEDNVQDESDMESDKVQEGVIQNNNTLRTVRRLPLSSMTKVRSTKAVCAYTELEKSMYWSFS